MKIQVGSGLARCALVTALMVAGIASAQAANGRIAFSGAIVAPTCSTTDIQLPAAIGAGQIDAQGSRQLSCGQTATDPGRSYTRTVTVLDATMTSNNQLLGHLASYTKAAGASGMPARLVVHTYE